MRANYGLILLAVLLLSVTQIRAQLVQTIRGRVVDRDTKQPLQAATVALPNVDPPVGAITDESGYFRIERVPVGRHNLRVTYMGYEETMILNLDLNSSRETVLNIELKEKAQRMREVVIEGQADKREVLNTMATVSARSFRIEESQRYAGSLNDVSRMAQNFAGVGIVNDQRNDLIIRGNSSFGVLYRLEGVDIPNPNHFAFQGSTGGPISILNNNVLSNSDFFTGAFPAEFGNAYAGAFDLRLRNGNDEKREFMGQVGFNGAEILAEGPFYKGKRASFLINYRYSTLELFKVMGLQFGTVAIPEYQDGNFHLNFPDAHGQWDVFALGGQSAIAFLDSEKDPDDTYFDDQGEDLYYGTFMAAGGVSRTQFVGSRSFIKSTLSVNMNGRSIVNDTLSDLTGNPFNVYENKSREGKISWMIFLNKKIGKNQTIKIGSFNDCLLFDMDESLWREATRDKFIRSDFSGNTYLFQPYVQHQIRAGERWTLNTGMHFMYFALNGSFTTEPRAGFKLRVTPRQSVSVGYGRHAQLPPLLLYFRKSQMPDGSVVIHNRGLRPLISDHLVLGTDRLLNEYTHVKLEAYAQWLSNVPVDASPSNYSILNQGANFDFSYPVVLVNTGSGRNHGLELTFEQFLHKGFYYLLAGSLFESYYTASDGREYNTAFNGNYALTFLTGKEWTLSRNTVSKTSWKLIVDGRVAYAGGLRYTPVIESSSRIAGEIVYDFTRHLEPRYRDYFRPDIRIAMRMGRRRSSQEWALDLQNIINRKNVFSQVWNPTTGIMVNRYQLGFFPVFLYRIYF